MSVVKHKEINIRKKRISVKESEVGSKMDKNKGENCVQWHTVEFQKSPHNT